MMPKLFQTVTLPIDELMQSSPLNGCAWAGCWTAFKGDVLPEGWRSLILFWAPMTITNLFQLMQPPNIWDRDCVLCPKHAAALEGLLKDIGNRLKATQGEA